MNSDGTFEALRRIETLVRMALQYETYPEGLKYCGDAETEEFKKDHPGAWLVLGGEFEIKCLCPEKYGINL